MESGDRRRGDGECRVPGGAFDQGRRRAFALDDLVRFAHVFETALDHVRSGRLAAGANVLNHAAARG